MKKSRSWLSDVRNFVTWVTGKNKKATIWNGWSWKIVQDRNFDTKTTKNRSQAVSGPRPRSQGLQDWQKYIKYCSRFLWNSVVASVMEKCWLTVQITRLVLCVKQLISLCFCVVPRYCLNDAFMALSWDYCYNRIAHWCSVGNSLSHFRSKGGVSRPRSTPERTTCVEDRLSWCISACQHVWRAAK